MWAFSAVARIEARFGKWQALVTLVDSGVPSSFFLKFSSQPTTQDATDAATVLVARLNEQYADSEFSRAVLASTRLPLNYETATAAATRFRTRYKIATALEASRLAYWIIERIVAGDYTDTQIRSVFGLTTTQYTAMKARMQTLHDDWVAVLVAAGE
jgi:hypothetical protein